jgi:hypothetical protein
MKKLTESNAASFTVVLIIITFVLRCFIAAYTGLGNGESYYFRGALHLDLSYFDQPPLFFWLGALSIKLFGLTNFGIRFASVLLFAGTSWLLFLVTKKLFNAKSGFWAVVIMNLSAVFTVAIACWYQPDAPLMFFWLVATYFIIELMVGPGAENSEATRYSRRTWLLWLAVGISMGLATLSKYHVLFLFAGVFMYVATNKNQRHWLRHPGPYIAVLITLFMALPILWWNYNNGWVSFIFQGSRAGAKQGFQLHVDWFFRSIGGQAAFLLPWIWFPTIRQLYISFKLRSQLSVYSFIFWMAVLPIVFFTVVTLWADLQFHFHWQAPGYMMLFIPLGFAIDKSLSMGGEAKRLTRRWLNFSVFFTIITIGVLSAHMVTGFWTAYGPKWVVHYFHGDNLDPTIQGVDYTDINTRFEKEGWLQDPNVFTGSARWWLTGKLDWALKGKKDIVVFNADARNLAFLVDPKTLIGKDAVLIGDQHGAFIDADAKPFFDSITQLPDIKIMRNGPEYTLQVYYCKNFHLPAQKRMDLPVYRQLIGLPPFGK